MVFGYEAEVVTAIATGALAVVALVSAIVALIQLGALRRQASVPVLLSVFEDMRELRPRWRQVYRLPTDTARWSAADRALADDVGGRLQNVAFLCETRRVPRKFVMRNWARTFTDVWAKLETDVNLRVRANAPEARRDLERFARRCERHLERRGARPRRWTR